MSPEGEQKVKTWRLDPAWFGFECVTSPLKRAVETASALGLTVDRMDQRLVEMDWGEFEGAVLSELRDRHGAGFAANEARGLDFRPSRGESPREVMTRIADLFVCWGRDPRDRIVVTHKGVRRAMLALATGWDMQSKPPIKVGDESALVLCLSIDGALRADNPIHLR